MEGSGSVAVARLTVAARSGSIVVRAGTGSEIRADSADVRRADDGSYRIDGGSRTLEVTCPEGTDLILGTSSGKVELVGRFGDVRITSSSGSVRVDDVRSLDVRLRSGSIEIDRCAGDCHVVATSGRVEIGHAGPIDVKGVSGTIVARSVAGGRVHTTSGRIKVGLDRAADLEVRAVSSSIDIDVPAGVAPDAELRSRSGAVRNDVARGRDCTISVRTVSGSISVR